MLGLSARKLFAFVLFNIVVSTAYGQETINYASLSGTVTDESAAVIQDAAVAARDLSTNQKRQVTTDIGGRFRFAYLSAGDYEIRVHKEGFTDSRHNMTLTVGAAFNLPVRLTVGISEQEIQVKSQAPGIETVRSQTAGTVVPQEVADLPLNARNYLDLALLIPGVSRTNTGRLSNKSTLSLGYEHLRGLNLIMSQNQNVPACTSGFNLCRPVSAYGNNAQYKSPSTSR